MADEHTVDKDYLGLDVDVRRLQPDWKNPPTVMQLKQDVSEASSSHIAHIDKVNAWLKSLRGQVNIKVLDGRSRVQPKLVRKQNEWRYASLEEPFLSTNDMFKVEPVTHMDVEAARQNQMILNKQFRIDIPKVKFINKYIRTAVNTGTVIIKLGWEEEVGKVREERMEPVFAQSEEEFGQFAQQLVEQGQIDEQSAVLMIQSGEWQQVPIGEKPVTHIVEKKYINRPVLEIKDSRSVIIDPSCEGNVANAQFIVDKFLTDLSSLKKDGRYDEEQLKKIREKDFDNRTDSDYNNEYREEVNFKFQDKPRQKLIAYEYWGFWDIHDDGVVVPIVATWIGDVMIRLEENQYPDKKLPFVVVQYLPPDTDTVYGDADASLLEDNQNIVGAVTRGMIDLMGRSANAQQGIRKDLLDPLNADRFKKGLDFEFNPVARVEDALFVTKMPEIPRSALEMIQVQNNEAEALTGVKAFSGGITSQAMGDTVGGIRSALDATAKRDLGILRRLGDGIKEVGLKIISMNSVWLNDEEVIRITDDEFVAIKRDDLAGNFDLSIEISTQEADNQKAAELSFLMQTNAQFVPFDILKLVLVKIAELRKVPDLAMAIKQFEPQPDPIDQAMKEAQIRALNAQAGKDESTAPKNIADEALKYAKAGQAGAATRVANSTADQIDLDFLNDSAGVTQDRALEQINTQERAKAIGKVMDNKSKPAIATKQSNQAKKTQ